MCVSFIPITRDEIEEMLYEVHMQNQTNVMPDWPARPTDAYPRSSVSVLVSNQGALNIEDKVWGYSVPWSKKPLCNTRADTALKKEGHNMWRESLETRRCIIPTLGFYEPHKTETKISPKTGKNIKQQYLFEMPDKSPLFIAGIYENEYFSMMTTDPNRWMQPIHDRMPVILEQCELETWLTGDYETLFERDGIELMSTRI